MYLISYDIENTPLRTRIANTLLRWGLHRIQYSVFLGSVNRRQMPTLWKELMEFEQHRHWSPADSIIALPIHRREVDHIRVLGQWPGRWEEITGETHTLIL